MTIIARKNAYHGSTLGGASLGGMSAMHEQMVLPVPDIVHIGDFKTAGETLTRTGPSEAGLEQINRLTDDIFQQMMKRAAAKIGVPEAEATATVTSGPYTAEAALQAGLIDGVAETTASLLKIYSGKTGEEEAAPNEAFEWECAKETGRVVLLPSDVITKYKVTEFHFFEMLIEKIDGKDVAPGQEKMSKNWWPDDRMKLDYTLDYIE